MDAFAAVAERFELRKFKQQCNAPGCAELPTVEAQVTEMDVAKFKTRELAALFLCNQHTLLATQLVDELKAAAPEGFLIGLKELAFGRLPGS